MSPTPATSSGPAGPERREAQLAEEEQRAEERILLCRAEVIARNIAQISEALSCRTRRSYWLPDESLVRTDKLTMAHALEERVPLLDLELLNLVYRLPSKWKLNRPSQGKKIFIDAMRPYLPPHIFSVKKQGFFSPAAKWLRGDLEPLARELLSDGYAAGSGEYVDLSEARRALDDHITKRRYGLNQVWAVMTFQAWYGKFMV